MFFLWFRCFKSPEFFFCLGEFLIGGNGFENFAPCSWENEVKISKKRKMAKKQFLYILAPFLECKKGIFFKVVAKRGKCKKNHFFAEMAYTHVGTKYIKRQRDFENF